MEKEKNNINVEIDEILKEFEYQTRGFRNSGYGMFFLEADKWLKQKLTEVCERDYLIKHYVGWIKAARCPQCDGSGAYYCGDGDVCQCQWCDERDKLLKSLNQK